MRQGCLLFLLSICAFPSYARVNISVERFADKSSLSSCPGSAQAKEDIDANLQAQLVNTLMQFNRYKIQQREVRPVTPTHRLVGVVRTFEVCARMGQPGQDAKIEIELTLLDDKGAMTHVFTSTASAYSGSVGVAGEKALTGAVDELARRIDGAILGKRATNFTYKGGRSGADKEYEVQLVRRPSSIKVAAPAPASKRGKRVAGN